MKKYFITLSGLLFPLVVFAHGMEMGMEMEEESGMGHQMEELLPFSHMDEGHYLAVFVSILLWASLIYTVYSLIKKFRKPPKA